MFLIYFFIFIGAHIQHIERV